MDAVKSRTCSLVELLKLQAKDIEADVEQNLKLLNSINTLIDFYDRKNRAAPASYQTNGAGVQGPSITYTNDMLKGLNGPVGPHVVNMNALSSYFGPR